ncbi:MAG: gamma-glutamyltransferase [Sphingomonadaceae bacterium]
MRFPLLSLAALLLAAPALAQGQAAPVETAPTARFYEPGDETVRRAPAETVATGPAVATAADPRAALAGKALLDAGGSAVDAALAMMISLTVVEPQSSGLGGGGFLVVREPETGRIVTLDGRETAPAAARPDRFLKPDGTPMPFPEAVPGGYSVGVPGAVALIAEAHRRWGVRPWAELFQPAIDQARNGFEVSPRLNRFTASRLDMLRANPEAAAIFLDPKGQPWPVGHVLKMPALAHALETIARDGPDAFYRGPVGEAVTRAVATAFRNPAALTAADLATYRVADRPPLCASYRRWRLCTMGPPSAGGIATLQILKQLERFDLAKLGPDNVLSWHLIAESQRLAFADREAWGADADFAPVPVSGLLDPAYLRARSALIRLDRAMPEVSPGTPPGAAPRAARRLADVPATSHMAAADARGLVANLTSTIEGPFGSGLVASGILLNNQLTDFDLNPVRADGTPALNRVEPGKRPRSSMAPLIVLDRRGRPVAAFGAAGGATIIAQVAKAVIAHLDWNQSIEDSLAAPQLVADRRGVRVEADSPLEGKVAALKALGHADVRPATLPLKLNALARQGAGWRAAADPRSEGQGVASAGGATGRASR